MQTPPGGTLQASAAVAISVPTVQFERAVESMVEYLSLLAALPQTRFAVVGNGMGAAIVPDRLRFFYVRLGAADGDVAEARCIVPLLNPQNDDTVLIRKERPGGLGSWVIIDWYGSDTPPLVFCEITQSGVWFLYTQIPKFQLLTEVTPVAAALDVPNWHNLYSGGYTAQFISPSTEEEVVVTAQEAGILSVFHSPTRGTNWDLITSYPNDAVPDKARFDESDRAVGFLVSFQNVTPLQQAELNGTYPVPGVGYTPFVAGDYFFNRNYQPLNLHVTADGGETWSDVVIEYFGQTYGFWILPHTDANFTGDPGGYCTSFPGTSAIHFPTDPDCDADPANGEALGFIVCAGAVLGTPTTYAAICEIVWTAPLHDATHTYITAGLTYYGTDSFANSCLNDYFLYTNKLYQVDAAGTIVDSFYFETDDPSIKDYFTWIETDRADDSLMYGVCSKRYDFNPFSLNTQSGKLFRMDWGVHTGTEISPHNPVTDVLVRVLSASTGTLFAPTTHSVSGVPHLILWRSVDNGDTWTSQDLTIDLGVTYSIYPILAEAVYGDFAGALVIMTADGKVAYSLDDGLTWAATGVVLVTSLNEVGTFLQDVGA